MANIRRGSAPVVRRNGGEWDPLQESPRAFGAGGDGLGFARVRETKDAYVFEADLPGFRDQDIGVDVTGNRMYYCCERSYGSFTRSFTLPDGIPDGISAELKNGILSLHVPKKAEAQPKRIPLRSGTAEKKQ